MADEGPSLQRLLDIIAIGLHQTKEDSKSWYNTLTSVNATNYSKAVELSSEEWLSKGIPLRVLVELRRAPAGNKSVENKQEGREPKGSYEDFSLFLSPGASATTTEENKGEKQEAGRKATASKRIIKRNVKSKEKASGKSVKTQPETPSHSATSVKINIVGKPTHPTILLQQFTGNKSATLPSTATVEVYGKSVKLELLESNIDNECSVMILVFARNDIRSLTRLWDKYVLTIRKHKGIQIPLLLVGIISEDKKTKYSKKELIMEIAEEMKILRYIEVTTKEQANEVFQEVARIIVREQSVTDNAARQMDALTKITRTIEKKNPELNIRKKNLTILPNTFLNCTNFLQRIRLDNNSFKYFPIEVISCNSLRELSLNANQIEEIPNQISKLTNLHRFEIENNLLDDLPFRAIQQLKNLQEFKVAGNPLRKLPSELFKGKELKLDMFQSYKGEIENKQTATGSQATSPQTPLNTSQTSQSLPTSESSKSIDTPPSNPESQIKPFKIFGVSLQELMNNEYKIYANNPIPRIVRRAMNFIIKHGLVLEGIFRLAGQNTVCTQIRESIENGKIEFNDGENPHNVTSLLKQWLRNLNPPALLYDNFDQVISFYGLEETDKIEKLKGVIESLPKENYHLVRQMCRLMYIVGNNAEVNRMDYGNISKVIGPNLLFPKEEPEDPHVSISRIEIINDLFSTLVQNFPSVFESNQPLFDIDFLQDNIENNAVLYRKLSGHAKSIIASELSSNGNLLWTADTNGAFRIWNTKTFELVSRFDTTKKRIDCMIKYDDNMWMGTSDSIQIRNEETGDLVSELPGVKAYKISTVADRIWVVGDGTVRSYHPISHEFEVVPVEGTPLLFATYLDTVWGGCADRKIRVWDYSNYEVKSEIDISSYGRLNSLTEISSRIWATFDNNCVIIWDPNTYEIVATLEGHHKRRVLGATKIGDFVWTYSWDGGIHLYHHSSFEYIGALPLYNSDAIGDIKAIYDESKDSHIVFASSWDKSITVWYARSSLPAAPGVAPPASDDSSPSDS